MLHVKSYIALIFIFLTYKLIELNIPDLPYLHCYLEDLLFIPILFKSALLVLQFVSKRWRAYRISKIDLVLITLCVGIYFEWLLPIYSNAFVFDWLDLICYGAGALFFWRFMNVPLRATAPLTS